MLTQKNILFVQQNKNWMKQVMIVYLVFLPVIPTCDLGSWVLGSLTTYVSL